MNTSGILVCAPVLAALLASSAGKAAEPTLADGVWVVIEHCGENPRAPNAEQKRGYDRRTEMTVAGALIAGHDRTVRPRDGAVTSIAYDGMIEGNKITITGTGTRSDINAPWTYAYEGTITVDGHAQLSGAILMRVRDAPDPVKVRICTLTFIGPKEPAKP